jgi:hypothetical protein
MVDPLTFALGKIALTANTVNDVWSIADRVQDLPDSDPGRVYFKVKEKMAKQEILGWGNTTDIEESALPAQSQAVAALMNLFGKETNDATVYVLYDKSGTGKSSAGMAVLKHFNTFPTTGKKIQGLMLSCDTTDKLHVDKMAKLLDAPPLLLAMDQPFAESRSLLIF